MYISINWIRDFVDLTGLDIIELIHRFSLSTAEVENEIYYKGEDIQNVVVGEIKTVKNHPNSDKLHILEVDIGEEKPSVVVCGATNVQIGMKTAFAKIGAKVKNVLIEPRSIAGIESHGMCCSESELGISDDNSGIMELDSLLDPGEDIKKIYDIDDIVFEVDNKSLTNRPDLWGHYGIAREFAALAERELLPLDLIDLESYSNLPPLDIEVLDNDCLRYSGIKIEHIIKKVSPLNMRIRLFYCGMRAINLLADLTNYLMLEIGQPMHAFDSKKVERIRVKKFERPFMFVTLDGITRSIDNETLMICDSDRPVAIAGVMGGKNSEIGEDTSSLILESACFDPVSIRKATVRLSHRTDASQRYEKSLDPEMTVVSIARFTYLLKKIDTSAKVISCLTDVYQRGYDRKTLMIDKDFIDRYTGIGNAITIDFIFKTLQSLGFDIKHVGNQFAVTVPSWRATKDVTIKADLIEEITRIYGYDNFTPHTAPSPLYPVRIQQEKSIEEQLKDILVKRYSLHELHSYVWVYYDECKRLGIEVEDNVRILNSTNVNLEILRNSIIPTQLCQVYRNASYSPDFGVFEIGRVVRGVKENGLCDEHKVLSITLFSRTVDTEELYFNLRNMIAVLLDDTLHSKLVFKRGQAKHNYQHPKNIYSVWCDEIELGEIGVIHPIIINNIDKKASIVYAEIDVGLLGRIKNKGINYYVPSKYPNIEVDLTFVSDLFAPIQSAINKVGSELIKNLKVIDVYKKDDETAITVRITFGCMDRTLAFDEVQEIIDKIVSCLSENGIKQK